MHVASQFLRKTIIVNALQLGSHSYRKTHMWQNTFPNGHLRVTVPKDRWITKIERLLNPGHQEQEKGANTYKYESNYYQSRDERQFMPPITPYQDNPDYFLTWRQHLQQYTYGEGMLKDNTNNHWVSPTASERAIFLHYSLDDISIPAHPDTNYLNKRNCQLFGVIMDN